MGQKLIENTPEWWDQRQNGFRGQFLIAMPSLRDPIFAQTITYICEHTPAGAMGIIINHPLNLKLGELFAQLELSTTGKLSQEIVLSGGPVQYERGFVIHTNDQPWESTLEVTPEIGVTASRDIIEALAEDRGPEKAIVALGYAGWEAGQLEAEIAANSWLTVPAENHLLFDTPVEQRWAAASRYLGIDLNLISSTAGHA